MAEFIDAHGNLLKADVEALANAQGALDAADIVVSPPRARLTTNTAALSVIDQYSQVVLFVSLIEIHKLVYFLVTKRVQNWSRRKQRMFTTQHIEPAWKRLHDHGWLATAA